MSTWYLWIKNLGEINDVGLDTAKRATVSFNVHACKYASLTWEEELVRVLVDAGVGTLNATIFCSSSARIPTEGADPIVTVTSTSGMPGLREQDQAAPKQVRPTAMITVRSKAGFVAARAKAAAAYAALMAVKNQAVSA